MRKSILSVVLLSAAVALPTAAAAQSNDNERVVKLTARVKTFCRISHQLGDGAADLIDGEARLGPVRELCNSARGYQVRAQFMNLSSGTLFTGDESFAIAADGLVEFGSPEARSRVREWRVINADLSQPRPIYLRVSISPI